MIVTKAIGRSVVDHTRDKDRRDSVVRQAFKAKRAFQAAVLKKCPKRKNGFAVELFAGAGQSPVAKLAGLRHLAVEVNAATAKLYKRRNPGAKVIADTWQSALKTHHDEIVKADVCVLEVDPFGRPFEATKAFLKLNQPDNVMLALVTYGYLFEQVKLGFTRAKAWKVLRAEMRKACRSAKCTVRPLGFSAPERVGVRATSKVIYGAFSIKGVDNKGSHLQSLASGNTPFRDTKVDKSDWDPVLDLFDLLNDC